MKIFKDIQKYSEQRKIALVDSIEKINWDTNFNPEEFLALLETKENREWALGRMIAFMPYLSIRRILTREFLKENITEEILSTVFPISRQKAIRDFYQGFLK